MSVGTPPAATQAGPQRQLQPLAHALLLHLHLRDPGKQPSSPCLGPTCPWTQLGSLLVLPIADPGLCASSHSVSEFLMGEVDSSTILSIPPSDQNQVSAAAPRTGVSTCWGLSP